MGQGSIKAEERRVEYKQNLSLSRWTCLTCRLRHIVVEIAVIQSIYIKPRVKYIIAFT